MQDQKYCPSQIPYPPSTNMEEDEIDLRELFHTIRSNKWKLFFTSLFITSLALIYVIVTPNSYQSKTILVMKEQQKPSIGGSAAALASLAGINLGGSGGGIDVTSMFKNLLEDFAFNQNLIKRYQLVNRISPEGMSRNIVYILNGQQMAHDIKNFFTFSKDKEEKSEEEKIFDTYKDLKKILSINRDKESGVITLSATLQDRFLAKELVNIYLKEMSEYMRKLDMKEVAEQEAYYNHAIQQADSIEMKKNLAELLSALTKKKVLSQAGEYYMVKQLTKPEVAFIKDKTKPKRGLIVVVAFITSIILGIFMIFFSEFLKTRDEEHELEIARTEESREVEKDRESQISF